MKVLLVLSKLKLHRTSNLATYRALAKQIKNLTWCNGTAMDLDRTVPRGYMYLEPVEADNIDKYASSKRFTFDDFDIAIVDQSLDLTQDQSPSFFGGGLANRSLDFLGADRPSHLISELTKMGIVCIGTSRSGICLNELADAGAVLTCPLEQIAIRLPEFMKEAQRLVEDNGNNGKLKALTLRQPFAWSLFHTGKDVENRTWPAKVRGTVAIHAADAQPAGVFEPSKAFISSILRKLGVKGVRIPAYEKLDRGAIIGLVDIVDCVTASDSAWFEGPLGFTLANPRLLPNAIPCKGKRRFFTLPSAVERQVLSSAPPASIIAPAK